MSGAASRTLPDVVGLDGAWVSDFAKQGRSPTSPTLMADASTTRVSWPARSRSTGKTYMIPVVNFVYPLFVNKDLLAEGGRHGSSHQPLRSSSTRPRRSARSGGNVKGWALPLDTAVPNGVQNDVMSWLWASGGSMLTRTASPT